jgi:hypothetical protein
MVYNAQNYWGFVCSPSGILSTRKHNVSETGSISVFRLGERVNQRLELSLSEGPDIMMKNNCLSCYLDSSCSVALVLLPNT